MMLSQISEVFASSAVEMLQHNSGTYPQRSHREPQKTQRNPGVEPVQPTGRLLAAQAVYDFLELLANPRRLPWSSPGGGGVAEMWFSCSDRAKSCLMISDFSCLFAFVESSPPVFANRRYAARAIKRPMNKTAIIMSASLAFPSSLLRACVAGNGHLQVLSTIRVAMAPTRTEMTATIISGLWSSNHLPMPTLCG